MLLAWNTESQGMRKGETPQDLECSLCRHCQEPLSPGSRVRPGWGSDYIAWPWVSSLRRPYCRGHVVDI